MTRQRIIRWILQLALILLSVFVITALLVQVPFIQTAIVHRLTSGLSEKLGAEVSIEKVRLKFFKTAMIHQILVKDQRGDTLWYGPQTSVSIDLFSLFRKKLHLNTIELSRHQIHFRRTRENPFLNYQFIIDHFSSGQDTGSTAWEWKINGIKLKDCLFTSDDQLAGLHVHAYSGTLSIYLQEVDFSKMLFHVKQIGIGEGSLSLQKDSVNLGQNDSLALFPGFPGILKVDQAMVEDFFLKYRIGMVENTGFFNSKNMELQDLNITLENLQWTDSLFAGQIELLKFKDHSSFQVDDLHADWLFSNDSLSLSPFQLHTPLSHLSSSLRLKYPGYDELARFSDSLSVFASFDSSHIHLADLRKVFPGFKDIRYLNTTLEKELFLSGIIRGRPNELYFSEFLLGTDDLFDMKASATINNAFNPAPLNYRIDLKNMSTSYRALKTITRNISISPGLEPWKRFRLSGILYGNLDHLSGKNVQLNTGSITRFAGNFHLSNLRNKNKMLFEAEIQDLRSIAGDLKNFGIPLPPALDSLGQFYYSGKFNGTIYDFALDGRLISEVGSLQTKASLNFSRDFKNAEYSGDLLLDSFNLGKVLGLKQLGNLSMDINIFGRGLSSEHLRATVLGSIQNLDFNGYQYRDLEIDGRFDKKQFAGHASMEDPNITFDFEGVVNLEDTFSRMRFRAIVDTLSFTALGFLNSELGFSGRLSSDFQGSSLDQMTGWIEGRKLLFSNLENHYLLDSLKLISSSEFTGNKLEIRSPLMQGQLTGKFSLENLSLFFKNYIDHYFPLDYLNAPRDSLTSNTDILQEQDWNLDLQMVHMHRLISLIDPNWEKIDTIRIHGQVDGQHLNSQVTGFIKGLDYNGISIGPVTLSSAGNKNTLDYNISMNDLRLNSDMYLPFINMDVTMENDTAYVGLLLENKVDSIREKLNLAAMVHASDGAYRITMNELMVLNGRPWTINPDHQFIFRSSTPEIKDLTISDGQQLIKIFSRDGIENRKNYHVDFKAFNLHEITRLLEMENAFYDGKIHGTFTLGQSGDWMQYLASLVVQDLTLKGGKIGNLRLESRQRTSELLDVLVQLEGGMSGLDIRGTYNQKNQGLDIQGEIDRLEARHFDLFLSNYISSSDGNVSGQFTIKGTTLVPVVEGDFEMSRVSTFIKELQARYHLDNEQWSIRNNRLIFRDLNLRDQNGNLARINGQLDFNNMNDPALNLHFRTDRFLVLNTSPDLREFFYGKLFVSADARITGSASRPKLDITAQALDSTDFVLQPLIEEVNFQQENFIIFAHPDFYQVDSTSPQNIFLDAVDYGMDIKINLECTPKAQLTIVVDPLTGDELVCRGNGNLTIEISPDNEATIIGNYLITSGQYSFNFQRVLKRNFNIKSGSRVTFIGDVFKSKFDITASYQVRTSTYELIRNQSTLNSVEESQSRQRVPVDVNLHLTGNLQNPIAKFGIDIAERNGSGNTSTVSSKLAQLREDESALNKQVFGLLIFGGFLPEEQANSSNLLAGAGQSAILSSVSNLLSNELNKLAKKYIKGVDLDLGVDSYSSNFGNGDALITELNVGLSKRLLKDRLTIKLGGNVQLDNSQNYELFGGQNSTFSGDFVLEYRLTAEGNYNLRFFQVLTNENNIFNPGVNYSETGVSIFFSKSFNSKRYELQLIDE